MLFFSPWWAPTSKNSQLFNPSLAKIIENVKTNFRFLLYFSPHMAQVFEILPHGRQEYAYHWGRVTHICVGKLTIIGSDNGLSPRRRQAIIWTSAGILLIRPLGTNFSEILIGIQTFSFKKMYLKMSSAKWRPFCLGINVLNSNTLPTNDLMT